MASADGGSYSTNVILARSLSQRASLHLLAAPSARHDLAFPLLLQSAQAYSLVARQAPSSEKDAVRKEWQDVMARAEACKKVLKASDGEGGVRRAEVLRRCDPSKLSWLEFPE